MKENNKKIKNIIRRVLNENEVINEVIVKEREPKYHEFHKDNSGKSEQYIFTTENNNTYVLSLKNSCLNLTDEKVINLCIDNHDENKNCYNFLMINFFDYKNRDDINSAFDIITNNNEIFVLLSNIYWLLNKYFKENVDKKYFGFSAEPKRMTAYENLIKNFHNEFHVFPKKHYDKSFENEMIIIIKK